MTDSGTFGFDYRRHIAATELRPEHIADFQRLVKSLRFGNRFQLLIAEFSDVTYRNRLISQVDDVLRDAGLRSTGMRLGSDAPADFASMEAALRRLVVDHDALHILDCESWFTDERWQAFNIRREAVARDVPLRLIFWLTASSIGRLARMAPDLWAWRSGVFSFDRALRLARDVPIAWSGPVDARPMGERSKRIAVLLDHLNSKPLPPDDMRLPLLNELAGLYFSLGELEEAMRIRRDEELPVYEKLGDVRSVALTRGRIADVLEARGELAEAMRIRRDEELPVYEKLGDVHSVAMTRGQMADILKVRGELVEALIILRDEALPVFEKLGDVRSLAVTRGKIADILDSRGELDEALRIRRDEELPVYEKLGDLREWAITRGKIAGILEARGELNEALRLFRNETLPAFEKLGDVRSVAITHGKIADILQGLGKLDEALLIRQDEELPVYKKLGDVNAVAATRCQIADILLARGELDEALRIYQNEALPVFEKLGDARLVAVVLHQIEMLLSQIKSRTLPLSEKSP